MSKRKIHRHLTLVTGPSFPASEDKTKQTQGLLFPLHSLYLVCIVHMPSVSDETFSGMLRTFRPSKVFDLRTVPSFSMGRLNRLAAFDLFEEYGSQYYDIPGMVGVACRVEGRLKASAMSEVIVDAVKHEESQKGPLMVLLDDGDAVSDAASRLPQILPSPGREGWSVHVVGGR